MTAAVQPQLVSACAATSSSAASRASAVASSSDATTAAATSAAAADLETPERGNKRVRQSVPTDRFCPVGPPSSSSQRCRKRAKVAGAASTRKQVDAAVLAIETEFASLIRQLPQRRAGEGQRAGTRVRLACLPACLPACVSECVRACVCVCTSLSRGRLRVRSSVHACRALPCGMACMYDGPGSSPTRCRNRASSSDPVGRAQRKRDQCPAQDGANYQMQKAGRSINQEIAQASEQNLSPP